MAVIERIYCVWCSTECMAGEPEVRCTRASVKRNGRHEYLPESELPRAVAWYEREMRSTCPMTEVK